jgi:plastocyanin
MKILIKRPKALSALILCSLLATACGGGEKKADTSQAANQPTPTPAPAVAPGAPAPITGKTWDVKMVGDTYDPPSITIKPGDGIRWTVVSGQPHDVTFWADSIPPQAQAVLVANMPQTAAPLTGELLLNPSQTYTISFAGAPAGTYHYYCTPHLALGMKGVVIVQ